MSEAVEALAGIPNNGMPVAILQTTDLKVSFSGIPVFESVSLRIYQAQTLAVMGPSGAGKSSLLGAILGLIRPDGGSIQLLGGEIVGASRPEMTRLRRRIGAIFQDGELFPELSPIENVALPARLNGEPPTDAIYRGKELLDQLEVPTGRTSVDQLSGGERQRVALARALINSPAVILADEPTGSLDSRTRDRVLDLIFSTIYHHSCALLLVTHDKEIAVRADEIRVMEHGTLQNGRR